MNLVNATAGSGGAGGSAGGYNNEILFVNFNQDCTSLAVGTKTGYRLYTINSSEKLQETYSCEKELEDICIVERLFSSSLIAIVSMANPRKLRVFHFKKGTEICNYCYSNTVLSVRLNRNRLVVCLEERIDIHNISDMRVIHTIRDIPSNPKGLCALSIDNEKSYLAYPGSSQVGEVQIFDTINLRAITMIPAHDSPLAAICFDWHGTKLATASEKGTVIRVFSVPQGKRLFEFRRGLKRNAIINSLSFSPDSLFLSASSNLETIHIFRLDAPKEKPQEDNQSWMSYLNKAVATAANYLPSQASEVLTQDRAFATVNIPTTSVNYRNICALTYIQKSLRLLMASADGYFYMFDVNTQEGGICKLLTQASLYSSNTQSLNPNIFAAQQQQQPPILPNPGALMPHTTQQPVGLLPTAIGGNQQQPANILAQQQHQQPQQSYENQTVHQHQFNSHNFSNHQLQQQHHHQFNNNQFQQQRDETDNSYNNSDNQ